MRVGLFGGSFDPVHLGHLLLAECCREQCRLEQIRFLPAAVPPHKQGRDLTPGRQRLEMLKLATAGHPGFVVSTYELDRGGVSYTVDTLRHHRAEEPQAELFLLLGADMLLDLPNWHEASEVCRLASPVVVCRPGVAEPDYKALAEAAPPHWIDLLRQQRVEMPQVDLASSEIRRRVAAGLSIRYQVPRAVEKYIETHGLYA
jgi:nicotinate-nucleotide adenylyltransferase